MQTEKVFDNSMGGQQHAFVLGTFLPHWMELEGKLASFSHAIKCAYMDREI